MNELKVFIAYQFSSLPMERSEISKMIIGACEQAQADLNQGSKKQIALSPILFDLSLSGDAIAELSAQLPAADLCVFEFSEFVAQAHFGIGCAIGRGIPCICLHSQDQTPPIASGISPKVFNLRYEAENISERLAYELYRRASDIFSARRKELKADQTVDLQRSIYREFWGLAGEQSVYLICPEIPKDLRLPYASITARDHLRLARFADVDSLFQLSDFLARYFPEVRVHQHTSNMMPPEANTENLVVIGGIAWNSLTAQITQRIRLPFTQLDGGAGNPDPIENARNQRKYSPSFAEDGTVQMDIGYFVRVPNPANKKRLLVIVNGVLTFGVLGMARCFTEGSLGAENCSGIAEKLGKDRHFAALMRVPVFHNYAAVPSIQSRDALIDLVGYSPERNEFT